MHRDAAATQHGHVTQADPPERVVGVSLLFLQAVSAESVPPVTGRGLDTVGQDKVTCKQEEGLTGREPGGPLHLE